MRRFCIKVLTVFLLGVPLSSKSQVFAADDVKSVAETLFKIYKLDSLANEYLFGFFTATDAEPVASTKFTKSGKKYSPSGFKIRGLKHLQFNIDQNQFFHLKSNSLHYGFKFRF